MPPALPPACHHTKEMGQAACAHCPCPPAPRTAALAANLLSGAACSSARHSSWPLPGPEYEGNKGGPSAQPLWPGYTLVFILSPSSSEKCQSRPPPYLAGCIPRRTSGGGQGGRQATSSALLSRITGLPRRPRQLASEGTTHSRLATGRHHCRWVCPEMHAPPSCMGHQQC